MHTQGQAGLLSAAMMVHNRGWQQNMLLGWVASSLWVGHGYSRAFTVQS